MPAAILGKKVGMTQVYSEDGRLRPVTVIQAGPCVVMQVKAVEPPAGKVRGDGYYALQLGFDDNPLRRATLPSQGHAAKAGTTPKRFIRELRLKAAPAAKAGDTLTVEQFLKKEGDKVDFAVGFVDVTAASKGKGFQGVMKRHHFGGQPGSHGTERKHRSPGSIGGMAPGAPGRGIKKGKRLPGHMGHVRITTRNHEVVSVDPANNLLVIVGNVPGPNGGYLFIRESKTRPGPKPPPPAAAEKKKTVAAAKAAAKK